MIKFNGFKLIQELIFFYRLKSLIIEKPNEN